MKIDQPSQYRMVHYSVTEAGPGRWRWTLHPVKKPDAMTAIVHGTVRGTQADAEQAAHVAIDKGLCQ
jgi:hypothetical protein